MITKYKNIVEIQSKFIKYCGYTKILSAKLNIQNDLDLQQLGFVEYLKITDLQIKQCQNISLDSLYINTEQITITMCNLANIDGIEQLTSTKHLNLYDNIIINLKPLKFLVNLESLMLAYNSISVLCPISNLIGLKMLVLENNKLTDIFPLYNLVSLKALNFNNNSVIDLNPLRNLKVLQVLSCHSNQIIDVGPLKCHQFKCLDISNNYIKNVKQIQHHNYFEYYEIEDQKTPTKDQVRQFNKIQAINNFQLIQIQQIHSKINLKVKTKQIRQQTQQLLQNAEIQQNIIFYNLIFAFSTDNADQ
ncbi:leucine-rich_repeat domain-containing protein [Hexamita inflata]|uniref:Leucine-rich repeat domain-containing protein n=1 Tax=Hexamita inflata TaxID=28002 RepID=A0AA86VPV5_9EUKA|nr:leucine-rich repeat domain-containing protein [Hexamita inflata]